MFQDNLISLRKVFFFATNFPWQKHSVHVKIRCGSSEFANKTKDCAVNGTQLTQAGHSSIQMLFCFAKCLLDGVVQSIDILLF